MVLTHKNVCIECGQCIDSLYFEFGEGNVTLKRCENCGSVADKYIEYELSIVLIDIILHRKPAVRHLLHNRKDVAIHWSGMLLGVMLVNVFLKAIVLYNKSPTFSKISEVWQCAHLIASSAFEHFAFVIVLASSLQIFLSRQWCHVCSSNNSSSNSKQQQQHNSNSNNNISNSSNINNNNNNSNNNSNININNNNNNIVYKFRFLLYTAVTYPEFFKCGASLLQIFDDDTIVLFMFGALIVSVQHTSLQSIVQLPNDKLVVVTVLAVVARVLVRCCFYSLDDVLLLGCIS